jgi:hypothetical protein
MVESVKMPPDFAMLHNSYFLSKVADERVETALKEAEMIRLAKLATQSRPSFWSSGRKLLGRVCTALSSGRIVLKKKAQASD